MTPVPLEDNNMEIPPIDHGERVVISGMSGLFPQCNHVKDLHDVLYNKVNPISSEGKHWEYSHPEVSQYAGTILNLNRFDAQFFGIHYKLGYSMDSMSKKMLEQTFQAIYDAGLSPEHLSGKKVGVYIGTCFSETEKACFYVADSRKGFGIAGCSKAMFANRISYWMNAKGPSVAIDEACCSSTAALEQAYQAMSRGECEAAIVGGANLSLHPQSAVHYGRTVKICMDGKTKSFDENADGCAKSDAINVLFLQKAKDAMRIYGYVMHVKSEFLSLKGEHGPRFGFNRDPEIVGKFLTKFYEEAAIPPQAVEYVEAFGSAVLEDDKAELEAISNVFCKNKDSPLLVGSVMSNIGYSEAATGVSSVTKVLLGYHTGELAANLHCSNPRKDIPALRDGRIQIVNDHKSFQRGFAAVNSYSITGCNAHVLLHGHYKPKDINRYKSNIPQLVTISGRHEAAVQSILDYLKTSPIDPEELALLRNIHSTQIIGHLGRGFTVLDTDAEQKTVSLVEACEYFDDVRRPLWFVYSGMGSQWSGMGTQLMRIPIFAKAIERCDKALKPMGIDIVNIITSPDKKMFDNILHSFVGIAAVQIGLTDVVRELGLVPDKIIGHSVGELGCAYADGCFTAEEMILAAYYRGLVSVQTPFIHGSMAAVGIGYQQVLHLLPPEIQVACHNSSESSTISGPSGVMREFVAELTAKGIFAKEVPCSNIAYHSRYIAEAGPQLLKYLSDLIKNPKPRSERWLSTSVPQDRWDEPSAKYSSAHYHTNNLLNSVLFEETSRLIPANAVLVEIAPHGLLQAILKRSLPPTCTYIPLTRRGHPDNPLLVLQAVGKLYMEGYNPKVEVLYPKVEYPVSTGTPFLSHLVQWAHKEKWNLPLYMAASRLTASFCKFVVTVHDEEHKYLQGNIIRGKNVYPFAASLVAVWDTLAMISGVPKKKLSVMFRNVSLNVQPILNHQLPLKLTVSLNRGNGRFEVLNGNSKIATGNIAVDSEKIRNKSKIGDSTNTEMIFARQDIYQMLYEKEFSYDGDFQSIQAANESLSKAYLEWNNNWETLIDGLLQLNALKQDGDATVQPAYIRSLKIDFQEHFTTELIDFHNRQVMKVGLSDIYDSTRCGGIVMKGVRFTALPKSNLVKEFSGTLQSLKFVPRFQSDVMDIKTAIQVYLQIVAENLNKNEINVIEILEEPEDYGIINFSLDDIPDLSVNYKSVTKKELQFQQNEFKNADLTLVKNLFNGGKISQFLSDILFPDAFVVSYENKQSTQSSPSYMYRIVSSYNTEDTRLSLARWKSLALPTTTRTVTVHSYSDLALLLSKKDSLPADQKLVVVTNYPPIDGLKDLIMQWRQTQPNICLVMVNQKTNEDQTSIQLPELDLAFNAKQGVYWGGEYYVPSVDEKPKNKFDNVTLEIRKIGDLSTLSWVETPFLSTSGLKVAVHYAGLNIVDVKKATGVIPTRNGKTFGMDFSGTTESGVNVMGIVPDAACSRWVTAVPELLWPVPSHWNLEEAASVPLPYAHAFYILGIKGRMMANSSVLIHGGAGALGQAAISICFGTGAQVFTTVSDMRKKHFLMKIFPELKESHIGCSRDNSFGDMVMRLTNGAGVNYVLNCLPGELRNTSLKCVGQMGMIFDTLQITSNEEFGFGMYHLTRERNFRSIDFSSLFTTNNRVEMRVLQTMISEGIERGYVRPLSRVSFAPNEAARAIRLLEASRHRGRVLLRLDTTPLNQPRITCSPEQSHLLVCDQEFYGLQLADRLIARGARKLLLNLPKIPASTLLKKKSWEKRGANVKIVTTNLNENKYLNSLIKETLEMGPIEGIYIISTANNKNNREVLQGIETVSRNLCSSLKYFVVISTDKNFGNRTCISRAQNLLPATKLTIPTVKKVDNSDDWSLFWPGTLDAFENAVKTPHPVIFAKPSDGIKQSLLEKIAAVSDIKVPGKLSTETVLNEIGVGKEKISAIASLLRDEYNVCLNEEDIPLLSIEQIEEIDQNANTLLLKEKKGLEIFFSHIDTDELMATTEIVPLPTLANSGSMRDDEVDVSQANLWIVPGLEGNIERFRGLCERLKIPALVLQPGLDFPHETLHELANRYVKILMTRSNLEENFYLLGYESGVLVALEIAAILEEHGLTGTVYCLGAAPCEFKRLLEQELSPFASEVELREAVIRHVFKMIVGVPCELELGDLTWQEKVEKCIRALLGRVPQSAQFARAQFEAAYGRLMQARQYVPVPRALASRIVLIHAANEVQLADSTRTEPIAQAELQQYSQQPITVHELNTTLAHALADLRCATIVNQYLHPDLLQEFREKNLCETYLLNGDTFMTTKFVSEDK